MPMKMDWFFPFLGGKQAMLTRSLPTPRQSHLQWRPKGAYESPRGGFFMMSCPRSADWGRVYHGLSYLALYSIKPPLNLHETSLNYIKHLCPPGISPRMGRGSYDYLLDPPCQRWVVKKLGVITRKISKTNCTPQHESLCHYVHCFFNIPALQGNKQCCYHKNKPCRACGMIASLA